MKGLSVVYLLCGLCAALVIAICILSVKIVGIRKAADQIRVEFATRLAADTNVGIDISTSDCRMRLLAADIDRQLKLLRQEHLRYVQGDRELKDAVTNISHDLRTPLTAICGYLELLKREDVSEPVQRYLNIVENRIDALKQLTDELFQYSVVASADRYDSRESVNLNQALEESVAAYYGALREKGITPSISMPEARIERLLNKAALSRILGNLIGNAIKHSDGDLAIALSEQGVITFTNHAKKLDEVSVGRLFDRFYTVESGKNSTGLGLSIAKALMERMGGKISAHYDAGQLCIVICLEESPNSMTTHVL